ncbi:MAG TPA: nicotinamide riboside transporter PnuC [Woeseiaceae bacterium]|nr:nicotinamide riboside transporter PnuC [Woeseiaceae bacterium]
MTALQAIAVALAIGYLLLAIRENIWCWFCAGVSTAIYAWVTFRAQLYMDSALNVFYFAMAIYGWYVWTTGRSDGHKKAVVVWPAYVHVLALAFIAVGSGINGYLLETRTDQAFPYLDSFTTWAAVWATFLVARKVLENWWYWLVIDAIYVYLYWSRDLDLFAALFVVYMIMIPFGIVSWTRSWREAQA